MHTQCHPWCDICFVESKSTRLPKWLFAFACAGPSAVVKRPGSVCLLTNSVVSFPVPQIRSAENDVTSGCKCAINQMITCFQINSNKQAIYYRHSFV